MFLLLLSYRALSRQVKFLLRLPEVMNAGHPNHVVNVFLQKCDEFLQGRTHGGSNINAQLIVDILHDMLQRLPTTNVLGITTCRIRFLRFAQDISKIPSTFVLEHIKILNDRPIGTGASATVYRGIIANKYVAVKRFRFNIQKPQQCRKSFIKEAIILQSLRHPNILPFHGVIYSESSNHHCSIVSPLMKYGTINDYVALFPAASKRELVVQLATGLQYLRSCHLVHGDIKGGNVLVDDDGCIRITDFGMASYDVESASDESAEGTGISGPSDQAFPSTYSNGGTIRWMSPERLNCKTPFAKATFASDVYSFGMVIYEIYSACIPFYDINNIRAILEIIRGERPIRDFDIPDDLWGLTEECWAGNPLERPEIEEIVVRLS